MASQQTNYKGSISRRASGPTPGDLYHLRASGPPPGDLYHLLASGLTPGIYTTDEPVDQRQGSIPWRANTPTPGDLYKGQTVDRR